MSTRCPNPFWIKLPSPPLPICCRDKEIEGLLGKARAKTNVVLYSPRRFGKTTLVMRAQHLLREEGFLTPFVDFYRVTSVEDVAWRIGRQVLVALQARESLRDIGKRLANAFKNLSISLSLEVDPANPLAYDFSPKVQSKLKGIELLDSLLGQIGRFLSDHPDVPVFTAFDEFQDICNLGNSDQIEGIMRSHIQRHQAAYAFIGSRRSILKAMFNDRHRPFFQSAVNMPLGPLPRGKSREFIIRSFKEAGEVCLPAVADAIWKSVGGYPFYIQRISMEMYDLEAGQKPELLTSALNQVVLSQKDTYEVMVRSLTANQIKVLDFLAVNPETPLTSKEALAALGMASSSVIQSSNALLADDLIEKKGAGWIVVDPLFSRWLRYRRTPEMLVVESDE